MKILNVSRQKIFGIFGLFHIHGTQCVFTLSFMFFSSKILWLRGRGFGSIGDRVLSEISQIMLFSLLSDSDVQIP